MQYRTAFFLARAKDYCFKNWTLIGSKLDMGVPVQDIKITELKEKSLDSIENEFLASCNAYPYYESIIESPEIRSGFDFHSCIPSWNAYVPKGSWLVPELSVRILGRWSSWIKMAYWAPDSSVIEATSLETNSTKGIAVATDTINLEHPANAFKFRIRLCSLKNDILPDINNLPKIFALSLAYSDLKPNADQILKIQAEEKNKETAKGIILDTVPCCSQMVYPDGGNVWCSPTSVAMVLAYWQKDTRSCECIVRAAVAGVYDKVYGGHGNWSFNVAYAANQPGIEAYAIRFSTLSALEPWIKNATPVVISISWNNEEGRILSGAPVTKSSGHLTTLVGFDSNGDPVMNEPASPSNETVRRIYKRNELETRWLAASGGLAYIIYPSGVADEDRARLF